MEDYCYYYYYYYYYLLTYEMIVSTDYCFHFSSS